VAKLPEPPAVAVLAARAPDVHVLPAGSELWRLYFRGGDYPTRWSTFRFYGPVHTARFDHHAPPPRVQSRGILYAAASGPTCIAEVFQSRRLIDRSGQQPWLAGFAITRTVALLNLCGAWATAAGASMALASGPRPRAQRWSAAIYAAYPDLDGLWYPSSMYANQPAVAFYERGAGALPAAPFFHLPLSDPSLFDPLSHLARSLGYGLI